MFKKKNLGVLRNSIPDVYKKDFNKLKTPFANRVCLFWAYARKEFEADDCRLLRLEIQACLYAQKAIKKIQQEERVTEKTIAGLHDLDGDYKHEGGTPFSFAIAMAFNYFTVGEEKIYYLPAHGDCNGEILFPLAVYVRRFHDEYLD